MTYNEFKYLYPPRPQYKIPPVDLDQYEGEFVAQPKYNGTACVVFTNGDELKVFNRHKLPLAKYSPFIQFRGLAKSNKWVVYCGEYLNKGQKGEAGEVERDKFIIWDLLVYDGEYLIGQTLIDRVKIIDQNFPCIPSKVSDKGLEIYDYLCCTDLEGIYKAPLYGAGFEYLYKDLVKTPLYEGIVLKKQNAKLSYGFQEKNNSEWQLKCRKQNALYTF